MAPTEPDELFHGMAPQIDHGRFIEEMNRMSDEQDAVLQATTLAEVDAARFQHELAATPYQPRAQPQPAQAPVRQPPRTYPQDEPRTPPQQLSGELVERLSKFMAQVEKEKVEDELRARDLEARALEALTMARSSRAAAEASQRIAVIAAGIAILAVILSIVLG